MIDAISLCNDEKSASCGECVWYSNSVKYGFRVKINFEMTNGKRFKEFEDSSVKPPKTAFKDALGVLIEKNLAGVGRIYITKYGQIEQPQGNPKGKVTYEISFVDKKSDVTAAKEFFKNKPDLTDYVDDLNEQLNLIMKTTGKKYISGKINIDRDTYDIDDTKGSCGCNGDSSGASTIKISLVRLLFSFGITILRFM